MWAKVSVVPIGRVTTSTSPLASDGPLLTISHEVCTTAGLTSDTVALEAVIARSVATP